MGAGGAVASEALRASGEPGADEALPTSPTPVQLPATPSRSSVGPTPPAPGARPPLDAESPNAASPIEQALRLESNLALFAGAGAGKTWSLITLCLHVLGGARRGGEPLPPANLCLLTFTDKAAAEMRQRLRDRLDGLARGDVWERELEASFRAIDRPLPPKAFWRAVRDELGAVSIGTFHSVMTQVLRRAPSGTGVNPAFELLDEREARALFSRCVERVVLARLEAGEPHVRALVRDFGFGADGAWGLVSSLVRVASAIREEGVGVADVPVQDEAEAKAAFDAALDGVRRLATDARLGLGPRDANRARVEALCERLAQVTFDTFPAHHEALEVLTKGWRRKDLAPLRGALRGADGEPGDLAVRWAALRMAPFDLATRALVGQALAAYEAALDERGALDFTGLLVRARDLLRDSLEARRDAQRRFKVVLVDEFQDTNRVQLELVSLLAERRAGAPRPATAEPNGGPATPLVTLPLEPASLAVVGDRKQAIYDFRGADVAVFEQMARQIEASGGRRAFLQQSRRSTAGVVELCNQASEAFLRRGDPDARPLPFEVEFEPRSDALAAVRRDAPPGPALVRLALPAALREAAEPPTSDALREAEAEALARHLASMVADPACLVGPRGADAGPRPTRGGDVAVLFQRFSHLEPYRQALVRHGVRHRVVRGRGFYAAQEVLDLASLLLLVSDPAQPVPFAAVLRSPLVGLTDAALASLALDGAPVVGLDPRRLLLGPVAEPTGLTAFERERLARFRQAWQALFAERDRLGLRDLVRVALEALDYRVAVAASPFGEQGLANLDKLLDLAATREAQGAPVGAFARELLELADDEPGEAQGDVLDDGDRDAVTLLTVHQAKGLEWPVVVVPELFAAAPGNADRVRFDRDVGLAVAPLADDLAESGRFRECKALRAR
ncbi:MAG: UvrD-helicase domain-containing protein, partial [Myxococcaceae bacterium]|nr:UvrD-helicase domain-containing protein [Myxococcaceae bacterium]